MTEQPRAGTEAVKTPVYLDYQATTPVDGRVLDAMLPYLSEKFGNPHSRSHAFGWEAEEAVEVAREQIAAIIGADPKEVIFTSGATESNNLAIKGVGHFYKARKDHVITCVTEHKCVLESCRTLEREGFEVTYLPVRRNGLIDLGELSRAFTERTALVSIMAVNNEIGVIQPLAEIGALCREHGAFFHTDAAQAIGRIAVDVNEMGIDLMSLTAHKVYGPKGIGALYVRRRPRVRLTPLFDGGGQERGFRSGTLPAPLCVGFGEACRLARLEMADEAKRISALRDRLYDGITKRLPGVALNGDAMTRIPGNLNLSFGHVDAEALMASLKAVAVSSGSACTSASLEPSFVLKALGVEDRLAHASIRFSPGRFTTEAEIDFVIEEVAREVAKLRESDPQGQAAE
ncbi:MAG: IscS subfamily cysteine desulfurase [Proteobacteria bacterium]|nr:IscS subfamily cysteine desulfurase [Pseudomonadota bacterium]